MIPAFPVYLFDVDGTLMDSASDICGAIQAVLKREDVDEPFLRRYIGRHLLERLVEDITHEGEFLHGAIGHVVLALGRKFEHLEIQRAEILAVDGVELAVVLAFDH